MDDLERCKIIEEAEPMAVVVMPWAKNCYDEQCELARQCPDYRGRNQIKCGRTAKAVEFDDDGSPIGCPLLKTIGDFESADHVLYLTEE